ncbi:hypothetical protein RM533_01380 [Croceicoccus sp. F390]|uniref:Uncharacterized protein n=1 Tax=Croceicoccus esteveae TaxID=3075597 RepID=A0ABU2ZEL8_9SPHN|nr:hypothetical protein [Croceicoccus sp. F390]MDT0574830.1 hypothetical protein [Croceicoccus sp. F390]
MASSSFLVTAAMVTVFAAVHLFIGRLTFLSAAPRSAWLSFSGGVAVSYVFLHVLPDLGVHKRAFASELGLAEAMAESMVYAVALLGLVVFYGLESTVRVSRAQSRAQGRGDRIGSELEWIHVASFATLNLLVGYLLLHRDQSGLSSLILYFVAMTLHFVTSDFGMRNDHVEAYQARGRWVITAAVVTGWLIGLAWTVPPVMIGFLFAFLAGGITLNVLKEELPEDRQSRFAPFIGGALVYASLMLLERGGL